VSLLADDRRTKVRLEIAREYVSLKDRAAVEVAVREILAEAKEENRTLAWRLLVEAYAGAEEDLCRKLEGEFGALAGERERLALLGDICLETRKDRGRARGYYDRLLKIDSSNAMLLDRLTSICISMEDWDAAAGYGEKLASQTAPSPEIHLQILRVLAEVYARRRQFDKAVDILGRAEKIAPADAWEELRASVWRVHRESGKLDAMLSALKKRSESAEQLRELHVVYSRVIDDAAKAYETIERWLAVEPGNLRVQREAILLAGRLGRSDRVIELSEKVMTSSDPSVTPAVIGSYAEALRKLGRVEQGLKTLKGLADRTPSLKLTACEGLSLITSGAEAAAWVDRMAELAVTAEDLLRASRGRMRLVQWEPALELLDRALRQSPSPLLRGILSMERGGALRGLGRIVEAEEAWRGVEQDVSIPIDVRREAEALRIRSLSDRRATGR
jgi:tetratricopeptide (TPR) repeat protein